MTETIVLIHGYGFDSRIWSPVELAFEGYHVIYLCLPGFGEDVLEGSYTIEQLAQRFWTEIDKNIAPVVHLIGHSMGGYVCMEMAAQKPERVSSVALIHSHVFPDPEEKKADRTVAADDILTNGREARVRKMIPSLFGDSEKNKEIIEALITRGLKYTDQAWSFGSLAMRDRKDHSSTLKNLNVPVLMIMGEKDKAVPPDLAFSQVSLGKRVSFHLYPEAGHLAMYENTAQMIVDLIRFYKGN